MLILDGTTPIGIEINGEKFFYGTPEYRRYFGLKDLKGFESLENGETPNQAKKIIKKVLKPRLTQKKASKKGVITNSPGYLISKDNFKKLKTTRLSPGGIAQIKIKVYERDNYKCKKCGASKDLTYDHIIPKSKGGKLSVKNGQTLCSLCNAEKGDQIIKY